jgi:hypothetical protein
MRLSYGRGCGGVGSVSSFACSLLVLGFLWFSIGSPWCVPVRAWCRRVNQTEPVGTRLETVGTGTASSLFGTACVLNFEFELNK